MELERLFAVLRKWWWFMLLATIVAGASSYLAVRQQPTTYQARAVVIIGNILNRADVTGNEISLPEQLAAFYAPVAETPAIRDRAKDALGLQFLPGYNARAIPNQPFIEIIVTDTDPERAKAVANEIANQLILQSPTAPDPDDVERAEFISRQINSLQQSVEETERQIMVKQEEIQSLTSARDIAALNAEIDGLQSKLRSTRSLYVDYLTEQGSGAINSMSLFSTADFASPTGSSNMTAVATVAVIGLVLAFGAAYLLEFLDDTVKKPEDLKWSTNLHVLPSVGHISAENSDKSPLVTLFDPRSPTAESYRALRTSIKAVVRDRLHGTLLVTSSRPGEGKSVTSANLAIAMAQQGHNVLLIDADLRRPVLHELFDLKREPGLADLLHELNVNDHLKDVEGLLKGVVQRTPERRLVVLTCGSVKQAAFELLNSEIMQRILDALAHRFDFVILDSPPVLAVSDALALSSQVDYVVMVADSGRIRRKELREAIARLGDANANVIGISLNRVRAKNNGFYYTYYNEYAGEGPKPKKDGRGGKKGRGPSLNTPQKEADWQEPVTQAQTENQ